MPGSPFGGRPWHQAGTVIPVPMAPVSGARLVRQPHLWRWPAGEGRLGGPGHKGQPPFDHVFVRATQSKAAAAVRIGAGLALRKRAELLELLRPCFARTEPWLAAGEYCLSVWAVAPTPPRCRRAQAAACSAT